MKLELDTKLAEEYPRLFPQSQRPFRCGCGDGWHRLISTACWLIDRHASSDFRWCQIKEKFGTLRMYSEGEKSEYVSGVVAMAESMSAYTCEECGDRGSRRAGGWVRTLCERCHENEQE
jgi:hypothetical protein